MSAMRILVDGSTGALGQATLAAIATAGHHPVAGTRRANALPDGAVLIPDNGRVQPAFLEDVDAIINCAGRFYGSETEQRATNVDRIVNLAGAAVDAGVRRFVQASSFHVYGAVDEIGNDTPLAPTTAYGRSKLAAERALADLPGAMQVRNIRLPFLFSRDHPARMGPLITLFRKMPLMPVAPQPIARSMLTYPDAAALLVREATSTTFGSAAVADAVPFTYELLAGLLSERGIRAAALMRVPSGAVALLRRWTPKIGERLFASNLLQRDANAATGYPLPHGLPQEIAALIDRQIGR